MPHKKKVISARDVIFDEEQVWNGRPLRMTPSDIQELDEAIEIVEVPQAEGQEDIQLEEDLEEELTRSVTHQADQEAETLDEDHEMEISTGRAGRPGTEAQQECR